MDFDEQEEEIGIQLPQNYQSLGNSGREKVGGVEGASTAAVAAATRKSSGSGSGGGGYRYRECLKNHAVSIGGQAVDGCGEFMAAGEEGTLDGLKCAACNCHRNFHRKETEGEMWSHSHPSHHHPHHPQPPPHQFSPYYHHHPSAAAHPSAGYFQMTPPPPHQPPLALPSTSREDEDMSNPSSSGGGASGGVRGSTKKRFRTKFSQEQKDKMLSFADRLGWRIQKHDEAAVQQFCAELGVKRRVLKVWMHNNKHTLGKKP